MRRVDGRVLVHAADQPLPARFLEEPQLLEDVLEPANYWPIVFVVLRLFLRYHRRFRLHLRAFRGYLPRVRLREDSVGVFRVRRNWHCGWHQIAGVQGGVGVESRVRLLHHYSSIIVDVRRVGQVVSRYGWTFFLERRWYLWNVRCVLRDSVASRVCRRWEGRWEDPWRMHRNCIVPYVLVVGFVGVLVRLDAPFLQLLDVLSVLDVRMSVVVGVQVVVFVVVVVGVVVGGNVHWNRDVVMMMCYLKLKQDYILVNLTLFEFS